MALKGSLILLRMPLGQTIGVWKFKQGMLEIDVNGGAASGHLTVDGPGCAIVGTASAKLLGTSLLDVNAGFFLGKPCSAGAARNATVASLIEKMGGGAVQLQIHA